MPFLFLFSCFRGPNKQTNMSAGNDIGPEISSSPHSGDSKSGSECCSCAWFNYRNLDPRVAELMYWRDVKKSAIVLGAGLTVLLPLTCYSFISVVSYLLLAVVISTLLFTFFKNCMQFVQKTGDGHPFKPYLDCDLALPEAKVRDVAVIVVKHLEHTAQALRHLLLAENFVDSVKFAVVLWCFTYIGSWFNGLTLLILAFVAFFTLPKFYETYKDQIDHYLDIACTQVNDVMNKVKAKIPIGKKPKQQ